jgi:hypothetical protein
LLNPDHDHPRRVPLAYLARDESPPGGTFSCRAAVKMPCDSLPGDALRSSGITPSEEVWVSSIRKFNIAAGVIVALAIVGFVWSWTAQSTGNSGGLVTVVLVAGFVFVMPALLANGTAIVDWFRVRVPPVIHDEVLGDVTYRDRMWRAQPNRGPVFWIEGRRIGPDLDLVRIGSEASAGAAELEAKARVFAKESGAPAAIGALAAISARRVAHSLDLVLEFSLPDTDDVLDVIFRHGEPVEVDVH